jgi:oligopeptide transport system substrate-binding protein
MDATYWSDPQRLVTNGPYRLADRRFKRYVHLLANEHYWNRAAMKNGSILERISTDPQNAVMAYDQGKADFLPDVPTASELAADLLRQERRDLHTQPMAGTYFYNFNCEAKLSSGADNPLADARVRRALSMAINRQTLVQKITRLNQPVAQTYIPPDALPDYQPPVEAAVAEDVPAARQLLADAGYPQGRGLDGLSILYNTGHGHETIAQAIQAMWKEQLGVIVTLRGLEGKAFSERLKKRDYTIARASWFGDYPDPTSWLQKMVTGDGNNDCGWSNGEYDALLAEADGEANPIKRMKLLRDAEAIVLREQPMALLYQYVNLYLFDPTKVRGLELNAWARWQLEMVENN